MLSRQSKSAFYLFAGPLMKINGIIYRYLKSPKIGNCKVHLGPGQSNYLEGWVNVDANVYSGKADVWADLRNPLPFHDESVNAMYSHHMVEHLPNIEFHLREVYRCLKPGGVYRMGAPNGDSAIVKFIEDDKEWFSDFPDPRTSIGGRFENFIFCRQEHLSIITYSYLEEMITKIGFVDCKSCKPVQETNYLDRFQECLSIEYEDDFDVPHTLIIEVMKPKNI